MIILNSIFIEKNMFHRINVGSCKIIFGPMFSGKSTKLRQEITTLADVGLKVLYINHPKDSRDIEFHDKFITTHHSGCKGLSNKVNSIKVEKLSIIDVSSYNAIAIDEGQFFEDIEEVVRDWVLKKAKIVIIASLDGDCMMNVFGGVCKLICICESGNIEKLSAFCDKCLRDSLENGKINRVAASFTAKINVDLENYRQVDVGGQDKYIPLCMGCYQKHMESAKEPIISSIDLDILTIKNPVVQCI